jgi:hypothetical protein
MARKVTDGAQESLFRVPTVYSLVRAVPWLSPQECRVTRDPGACARIHSRRGIPLDLGNPNAIILGTDRPEAALPRVTESAEDTVDCSPWSRSTGKGNR